MRFILAVLLAIPAAMAVNCYLGTAVGYDAQYAGFDWIWCGDMSPYCYTQDITIFGVRTIYKGCGAGICGGTGYDGATGTTCCYGDFCNSATSSSLLVTSLVALAAAWLWC